MFKNKPDIIIEPEPEPEPEPDVDINVEVDENAVTKEKINKILK
jgi:hypothetical protein